LHSLLYATLFPYATLFRSIEAVLDFFNRLYVRVLAVALRNRLLVLGAVGGLFAASLLFLLGIDQEFFPQVDAGQITLQIRAPSKDRKSTRLNYSHQLISYA